jgi:hypothetical protein
MELNRWVRNVAIAFGIVSLAACSTFHKRSNQSAINDENEAYMASQAQTSGLGNDSGFSDQGTTLLSKTQAAQQRIYYFAFDSNVVRETDKPAINRNAQVFIESSFGKNYFRR